MNYSVSNEEMELIAKELGLTVSFNSQTPGVLNTTTGEITSLEGYFEGFFDTLKEKKVVPLEELSNMKLRTVKPKENEQKLNDYLFFTDEFNIIAG